MMQRLLTILLVFLVFCLAGGPEAAAAPAHQGGTKVRSRTCLVVNSPFKQDLKVEHTLSVRCRIPSACQAGYPRNPNLSGSLPEPLACGTDRSGSAPAGADTAYILRLIYPFHGFL